MTKTRLEAFSDGVIAIIITIMVLELKVPHEATWIAIQPLVPVFISYVFSYVFIGIYWGNHHHLLHTVKQVNGKLIWANLHLLFWLSLVPFATAWMGENNFEKISVVVYAGLLNMCGLAYYILLLVITRSSKHNQELADTLSKQGAKGKISLAVYFIAMMAAFLHIYLSVILFFVVSVMWIVPDRNIEKNIK